jgi:hypothetical protein
MIERPRKLSDASLLDLVQRQTFRYFWDFAHPVSGLARERSHVADPRDLDTVTSGGSGFGVMWDLFMSCNEIREGLAKLGFTSPRFTA